MNRRPIELLICNLATDADDPVLGFTTSWINALARRCSSVDVLTMTAGRLAVADNVQVSSLGKESGHSELRRVFRFYAYLTRRLRRKRLDSCFCHMTPLFAVMAAPLLRPRGVRLVVWYAHGAAPYMLRAAERVADAVVTPTAGSFPFRSDKVAVVGHGIDTSHFTPRGTERAVGDSFSILVAGRIAPIKRLEVVVRAIQSLAFDSLPHGARVRLVGPTAARDVGYAEELRRSIASAGLADRVVFEGPVPYGSMPEVYRASDLLVSASQTRSADKVVLEAMACGLPVVTSNPAFASILEDRAEVAMAPPDDPRGLAQCVRRVLQMTAADRREMGLGLRQIVERDHSLDRLADRLVSEIL